jgi:uncharacterized protein YggE
VAAVDAEATVEVRGEAILRAEADEALVWITLTATDASPGPALSDVAARGVVLAAILDELGVEKADRTTAGVTVSEEFDHTQQGRRSLGHRAAVRVALRLTDSELIGQLASRAVEELSARIEGPSWHIAPDNPVRLEAAREAARDAERKARAYADGVGATLGRPIRLIEPEHGHIGREVAASARFDSVPIDPGEHEVAASIRVTFALETDGTP